MNCGNLIDVCGTKEAWSYVVEVVEIIETRAKVSINILLILCILFFVCFFSFALSLTTEFYPCVMMPKLCLFWNHLSTIPL